MLKLRKSKILVGLISIIMVVLVLGNIHALATDEGSGSGALQLTKKNATTNSNTAKNATSNTEDELGAAVGATNKASNNSSTNKARNNTSTNASKNNANHAAASKLPYAGSNTSIAFILIALGASAVYAYKKVSDYNI